MGKARFTLLDLVSAVQGIKSKVLGARVANVYDVSPKVYLIKLAKGEEKFMLLIESGIRIHTTKFQRDKSQIPSGFALKLRKHMRTKRLEDIRVLGFDRVVELTFGSGENACHLIVEFFAQGNVVLTDSAYAILSLLRTHAHDESARFAVRETYPMQAVRPALVAITPAVLEGVLAKAEDGGDLRAALAAPDAETAQFGPALVDHAVLRAGLPLGATRAKKKAAKAGKAGAAPEAPEPAAAAPGDDAAAVQYVYDEYSPCLLAQHEGTPWLAPQAAPVEAGAAAGPVRAAREGAPSFATFDEAVDEFYSKVESQKLEQQRRQQEQSAAKKLAFIKADHERRIRELEGAQEANVRKAQLIEANLGEVEAAITTMRVAVAHAVDWNELGRQIKAEKKAGNPVAATIHSLQLERNAVTLLLTDPLEDAEEERLTAAATPVEIDLDLGAYANARTYYDQKRKTAAKHAKTVEATDKALKAAEKKTREELKKVAITSEIKQVRKTYWFEKFNWFVTTENYLVVSGRDAQQNETLVKRHMRKGDLYVHADIHGAASCIIKNPSGAPVPPITLQQAGCMTVCRSNAWDAKVVTSAWWVYHDQVSKTAPTGEYLVAGSFMIRGKKNFLPPAPLIMGFAVLFKLAEECVGRHVGERAPRTGDAEEHARELERYQLEAAPRPAEPRREPARAEGPGPAGAGRGGAGGGERERGEEEDIYAAIDVARSRSAPSASAPGPAPAAPRPPAERPARGEEEEEGRGGEAGGKAKPGAYLTAKQRRDLKKGKAGDGGGRGGDEAAGGSSPPPQPPAPKPAKGKEKEKERGEQKPPQPQPQPQAAASNVRGKKGKLKKIKEKYADQDEEDRALALELLKPHGKEEKKAEAPAPRRPPSAGRGKAPAPSSNLADRTCFRCGQKGHLANACKNAAGAHVSAGASGSGSGSGSEGEEGGEGGEGGAEGRAEKVSRRRAAREARERERREIAAILEEENVAELPEGTLTSELDALTGIPRPDDVLLFAVPVCGPYSALTSYKFKVKLVPGSQKKGKAARQAQAMFVKQGDATARERDLVKALGENELFQAMIGSVKIASPGAHAAKK
eukprot:tig00001030_g6448.t1